MALFFRVNQSRPCVVLMSSTTDFALCVAMRGQVTEPIGIDSLIQPKIDRLAAAGNVFYRQSWQETMSNSGKEIGVVTFPLLALDPNAKRDYRPLSGSFRQDLPQYFGRGVVRSRATPRVGDE